MNYVSIGYKEHYEKFKENNKNNSNYTFNDYSHSSAIWGRSWVKENFDPIDKDEKILVTLGTLKDRMFETVIGTYDTFEEAYQTALDLNSIKININAAFIDTIFSNKNIKYSPLIHFVSKTSSLSICYYSYDLFPFDPNVVSADTFNYEFLDNMDYDPKIMIYKWTEDKHIQNYIKNNLLKNLDSIKEDLLEATYRNLLIYHIATSKELFDVIYKKDFPLKKQYNKLDTLARINMFLYSGFESRELFTDNKIREILEECMMNTPYSYNKACYYVKNYSQLSKKYEIDIYEILKQGVTYKDIKGTKFKNIENVLLHAITKCIYMNSNNFDNCFDLLFYAIDKAKKKDLNDITLELIAKVIINNFNNYRYYCFHNTVQLKNENNIQLIADSVVDEMNKSKKNKINFIKHIQRISNDCKNNNSAIITNCILKSINTSNHIPIKKALVKIGVEMK